MKQIPNYPCYFADELGNIYTTKRKGGNARAAGQTGTPIPLKTSNGPRGYRIVSLDIDGKTVTRFVHQLVLETFVGPCPDGMEACHYPDFDKSNNSLNNLRWDTHAENMKDRYRDRGEATEKACKRCGEVKSLADFYKDSRSSDGLKTECKKCHVATAIASRDPEKKREANREYMRRVRA